MQVDIIALKQDFRTKARAYGIDPTEGATTYQVANLRADRAKAEHTQRMSALVAARPIPDDRALSPLWWADESLWLDLTVAPRRAAEALAFLSICLDCKRVSAPIAALPTVTPQPSPPAYPPAPRRARPRGRLFSNSVPVTSRHALRNAV